jgi:hypothetical protein
MRYLLCGLFFWSIFFGHIVRHERPTTPVVHHYHWSTYPGVPKGE